MEIILNSTTSFEGKARTFILSELPTSPTSEWPAYTPQMREQLEKGKITSSYTQDGVVRFCYFKPTENTTQNLESLRRLGHQIAASLNETEKTAIELNCSSLKENEVLAFVEGFYLSLYQFEKYKKDHQPVDATIYLNSAALTSAALNEYQQIWEAVFFCRDLVNEPANKLTTAQFAEQIAELHKLNNVNVEILTQNELIKQGFGGLLAVNQGSETEARFAILEYLPENQNTTSPIVLVGKGVVYDTGGHSLKPTPNSMDMMKCDMAGAATVVSTFKAVVENQLPCAVICLVPITDNMLSAKAFAPGDVITMYDGTTVEVKNTDAEGRLILADALSYAKKYKPRLVIDVATLTGAALRAIGHEGIVYMGNATEQTKQSLNQMGEHTYERLVEFPLWEEYGEMLKSDIADLSNLGPAEAGAISAGKFLEHFIDYNWLHLDIAGPAFLPQNIYYRSKNASGTGVRLLYHFIKESCK